MIEREVAATAHLEAELITDWQRVAQELQEVREAQISRWMAEVHVHDCTIDEVRLHDGGLRGQ